jgi:hypothetical protein
MSLSSCLLESALPVPGRTEGNDDLVVEEDAVDATPTMPPEEQVVHGAFPKCSSCLMESELAVPGRTACNDDLVVEDDAVDPTPTMPPEEPLVHGAFPKARQEWEGRIISLPLAGACKVLTPTEEVDMEETLSTVEWSNSPTGDAPWTDAEAWERSFQPNHDTWCPCTDDSAAGHDTSQKTAGLASLVVTESEAFERSFQPKHETWCPCTDDSAAGHDTSEKAAGFVSPVVLDVTEVTATMRRKQKSESLYEERCSATVEDPYAQLSPVSTPTTSPPMANSVAPDEQLPVGSTDVMEALRQRAQVASQWTAPMLGRPKRKHPPRCISAKKKRSRGGGNR